MKLTYMLLVVLVYTTLQLTTAHNDDDTIGYLNEFDEPFYYKCPSESILNRIRSDYSIKYKDRRFGLGCLTVKDGTLSSCQWHGYVNEFNQDLNFTCPGGVISGFQSYHHNYYEDRRWKVYCCKGTGGFKARRCQLTDYVNDFYDYFLYTAPADRVIHGIYTHRGNDYEDSKWRFYVCTHN